MFTVEASIGFVYLDCCAALNRYIKSSLILLYFGFSLIRQSSSASKTAFTEGLSLLPLDKFISKTESNCESEGLWEQWATSSWENQKLEVSNSQFWV